FLRHGRGGCATASVASQNRRARGRRGCCGRFGRGRGLCRHFRRAPVKPEEADLFAHGVLLVLQRLGGGGIFLDQGRVLLRHFVHLVQRLVDLVDAGGLFRRGGGDFRNNGGDALDGIDDLLQRLAGLVDQIDALLHL